MNHEAVLAVLSNSKEEAKSIKEIALAMDLEITSHIDWIRVEQRLARSLNALIRWGWVACDRRQQKPSLGSGIMPIGRLSWQDILSNVKFQ